MGITGLLPYLKTIHTPVNISQFQGFTVAVDAYCWLHKGAFSCADKLALGETSDQYVHYCMKYVNNMLKKKIRPILVFDGCRLPSKKDVENTRKERREMNRKKAVAYLREGKRSEARECLQRSVDVTPQMALQLMNASHAGHCIKWKILSILHSHSIFMESSFREPLLSRRQSDAKSILLTKEEYLSLIKEEKVAKKTFHQYYILGRYEILQCGDIEKLIKKRTSESAACREQGVDCIVAPYEADAQLAYLNKIGVAQIVVTEDSDLLLFGCDKVIFKMDVFGNGILVEQSRLNEVLKIRSDFYTFDKFRYICILSGCDYLASLPGIGLAKANKVFRMARQPDLKVLLSKLPSYLKMKLVVTQEYIDRFLQADNTFLYQLVFDPMKRCLIPLNPYPPEVCPLQMDYAGPIMGDDQAFQIALGNIDTTTGQRIGEFDPATIQQSKCHIWDRSYNVQLDTSASSVNQATTDKKIRCSWKDELLIKKTNCKRNREVTENMDFKSDKELAYMYDDRAPNEKKFKVEVRQMDQQADDSSTSNVVTAPKSPLKDRARENKSASFKRNTFAVQTLPYRSKLDINKPGEKVCSRYFSCNGKVQEQGISKNPGPEKCSDSQTLNGAHFESCLPAGSRETDSVVARFTAASHVSSTNISVSVFNWSKFSGTSLCGKQEECLLSGTWQKEDIHLMKANEDPSENAQTLTFSSVLNRPEPCTPTPRNAQRLSANKVMSSSDKPQKDCRVSGLLKKTKVVKQTNLKDMFRKFAFKK